MSLHLEPSSRAASRRDVLQTGMAIAAGLSAVQLWQGPEAHAADAPAAVAEKGFVDAHVHVWTPDIKKYPLDKAFTVADMQPRSFTPEQLFEHCKPCGVDRIVLIQMSFYGFDNSYMLDVMRRHPGVFSGVAVIDENAEPAAAMKKLKGEGVRGFRIRPGDRNEGQWLAGEGMKAMWRCGAEEGLNMCCLIDAKFLPSIDAMCERHPDTPVVIDHFARIGVDGQLREGDIQNLCRLARHKQTSVKVSAFYALGKKAAPYTDLGPMVRKLLDAYGPERLMWATDCPYQVDPGHNYRDSVELIRSRLDFLSANDRAHLLRKTAERVFFS